VVIKTEPNDLNKQCGKGNVLYQSKGITYCEEESVFLNKFNVDGIARVPFDEFITIPQYKLALTAATIPANKKEFLRFNMGVNNSIVGGKYLVMPIMRSGSDSTKTGYVSPLLSIDEAMVYKVNNITNHISYNDLPKMVSSGKLNFQSCVSGIFDIASLQHSIVDQRYAISRPDLTRAQRVSAGVAITSLSLINFIAI